MWRSARFRIPAAITLSVVVLHLAGCGPSVGKVSGKVTYQDQALKGGNVIFWATADGGRSFSAGINEEGIFTVPDLHGGSYKVTVETGSLKPTRLGSGFEPDPIPQGAKTGPPPGVTLPEGYKVENSESGDLAAVAAANAAKRYIWIPERYADPATTDLAYTYKGGSEQFNIDLK